VNVAIGTDTFPMDMVAELRWASILARVADANYQAGQPRDVFNAATLAACKFLRRDDLGRLAPGAKADIVLINLDHLGAPVYATPSRRWWTRAVAATSHGHRRWPGPDSGRPLHAG
jgi:cytosine/adenosine deaminase-related metal-dependent hydrolase